MSRGISDGNGTALRDTQKGEPINASGFDHRLEIPHPCVERECLDLPVGHAIAASVIADQCVVARQPANDMSPDRAFPIILKVVHPIGGLHQRSSAARYRISETNPARGPAILDLLFHFGRVEGRNVERSPYTLDREDFDRLDDVLQSLRSQFSEAERELSLNLIVSLTRDVNAPRLCDAFQAGRDVDALAINALRVVDDVPNIDAHAELHASRLLEWCVTLSHRVLNGDCAFERTHNA